MKKKTMSENGEFKNEGSKNMKEGESEPSDTSVEIPPLSPPATQLQIKPAPVPIIE